MVSFLVLLGLEQFRHPQLSPHSCTEGSHPSWLPCDARDRSLVWDCLCPHLFFFFFRKCDSVIFKHLVTRQQQIFFFSIKSFESRKYMCVIKYSNKTSGYIRKRKSPSFPASLPRGSTWPTEFTTKSSAILNLGEAL